jgi:peptidoglycan biosynthesis protein MviN/MurJ (putative lipid II flippase)
MVVGSLANAAIVAIVCHHQGIALRPSPASCSEFLRLPLGSYGWLVSAGLFTALTLPVNYMFAGMTAIGGVSGWALGSKMILLSNGLIVVIVGTILLPHMAKSINLHTNNQIGRYFLFFLLSGTWFGGIVLLGASLFAEPIVASLLRGPNLTEVQVQIVSQVFRIGFLQLPVLIVGAILIKAAAVTQRSFATVLASALVLAVNIAMGSFLVRYMGILGIAYASLAAGVVGTLYLVFSTSKMCGIRPSIAWILMVTWGVWACASLAIISRKSLNIYFAFGLLIILAVIHVNIWRKEDILRLSVEVR